MRLTIQGLDAALAQFADQRKKVELAGIRTANKVASKYRTQASRDIRNRYNLNTAYVNDHLRLTNATRGRTFAEIRATQRGVLLSRYGAKQLTKAAKFAKGDARRGIRKGRKQAGVSFQVLKARGRLSISRFFLIPLKRGSASVGNGMGVAVRTGKGRDDYEVLHSISVDQMFKHLAPRYKGNIETDLAETFDKQLAYELGR
jgi:hypothetical protein